MKKTIQTILIICLFSAQSYAINFDGCYKLSIPDGTVFTRFCLDGTQEEGINGMGARLVVFKRDSDLVNTCAVSSSLKTSVKSLEFIVGEKTEVKLNDVQVVHSQLNGIASFGLAPLMFSQLDDESSKHLISKFYAESRCKNVRAGELIKLK